MRIYYVLVRMDYLLEYYNGIHVCKKNYFSFTINFLKKLQNRNFIKITYLMQRMCHFWVLQNFPLIYIFGSKCYHKKIKNSQDN